MIWRNLFTVWENEKFSLACSWEKNSSNQLFSNCFHESFVKNVSEKFSLTEKKFHQIIAFTKFLRKKCEREFLQFSHCAHCTVLQEAQKAIRKWAKITQRIVKLKELFKIIEIICQIDVRLSVKHFPFYYGHTVLTILSQKLVKSTFWLEDCFHEILF